VLVTLNTALLVVIAVHFMRRLEGTSWARVGLIGAVVSMLGALMLAVDKGALCLTMSALDTVSEGKFAAMMPGLLAMYSHKGWLVLLYGIALLPLGFAILAIGLLKTRALPRWQSALFLTGVLLVAFPDGAEIVNLTASILMAVALLPYGMRMLRGQRSVGTVSSHARQPLWALTGLPEDGVALRPWPRESCRTCRRK
jgi:hypothetical protein